MAAQGTRTRQGHLGMNTPPIVSPEAWEAARQQMLANERADENHLRNFTPGPPPNQTKVPARPPAGKAPRYQVRAASADTTADTRAGEMAQAGRRVAYENHLRNFTPGPPPNQTKVPARPPAGKAPGYQVGAASTDTTADTRAGELAQAGHRVAYEFEGPNGKVSPTTLKNHSRALSRFLIAFCSGVAATLVWWSYGDAARQVIASSYPQLLWLAPPRTLTAPEAPDTIVPYQFDAMLRELHTMRQSLDRIVAGQEPMRNTDQTTTSVDQAPSAQVGSIPSESRGDAASLQPTVPLNIKSTKAKALQTLSDKGKQLSAANQHDASCFPSVSAVLQNRPGGSPTWTLRAPGHEGTQCWYAAGKRPSTPGQRPTQGKRPIQGKRSSN